MKLFFLKPWQCNILFPGLFAQDAYIEKCSVSKTCLFTSCVTVLEREIPEDEDKIVNTYSLWPKE
jgi:hypothetical protein